MKYANSEYLTFSIDLWSIAPLPYSPWVACMVHRPTIANQAFFTCQFIRILFSPVPLLLIPKHIILEEPPTSAFKPFSSNVDDEPQLEKRLLILLGGVTLGSEKDDEQEVDHDRVDMTEEGEEDAKSFLEWSLLSKVWKKLARVSLLE